jgi:putative protease
MRTLHQRGVRGYITFNTLVFEHEMAEAARTIASHRRGRRRCADRAGRGIAAPGSRIAPGMELHASTQMSITNAAGVRFAQQAGAGSGDAGARAFFRRGPFHPRRNRLRSRDFRARRVVRRLFRPVSIVGSLGRAQRQSRPMRAGLPACPIEMMVDGRLRPLDDARYLLSPGDLYALAQSAGDRRRWASRR